MQLTQSSAEVAEPRERPHGGEPHWRPASRFLLAVVVGAGLTELVWRAVPVDLSIRTNVVGYPIANDFNYQRYLDAYYLIAIVFPVLSIAACFVLGRWGPLRRPNGDLGHFYRITTVLKDETPNALRQGPSAAAPKSESATKKKVKPAKRSTAKASGEPESQPPPAVSAFWAVARMAVPAAAVAVEVGLIRSPHQLSLPRTSLIAGVAYLAAVAAGVVLLRGWRPEWVDDPGPHQATGWWSATAPVNSLLALVVLPMLFFVSEKTNVFVTSEHRVVYYHWLPLWLVIVVTIGCVTLWARGMRRARSSAGRSEVEATVLTWLVGPIMFFLLLAVLPGALGQFQAFDDAQYLAAPQLIFHHGLLPWRDIFLLHGILQDVFYGVVGLLVFGNTRWGGDAGIGLFMTPLFWLVVYAFTAYFCRKNRLILVALVVAVVINLLQGNFFPFLVIFVLLILFDRVIRNPAWSWCLLFSGALIVSCIIVPQAGLFALPLAVLVVIFDAVRYRRGASIVETFRRTIRCGTVGIGLLAIWAVYLAVVGALGDFFDFYLISVSGHALEGAYPTQWKLATDPLLTFEFFAPVLLWLATVWRVVAKLRARRPWSVADWVMVGAASCVVLTYPQALERADSGHVLLVFSMTLPLLILWAIELLSVADRSVTRLPTLVREKLESRPRRQPRKRSEGGWPKRLVTTTAVAGVAMASIAMPLSIPTALKRIPSDFHALAENPPPKAPAMLGYTIPGTVDTAQINTLGSLLDRYAGRRAPVFDFVNEIGITYYLLNRVPGTRSYIIAVAQTSLAQNQTVSDLEKSRPPVVIFYDTSFGLPGYDVVLHSLGMPETAILQSVRTPVVGQYILDHYRPLVNMQGQLLMLRDDLVKSAPPLPPLPAGSQTTNLYFSIPTCALGDIPNFYANPPGLSSAPGVRVPAVPVEGVKSTIAGWAVDRSTGRPAAEVLAVADDKVVASAPTGSVGVDPSAAFYGTSAVASEFSIDIPTSVHAPVTLYALNADGSVSLLLHDRQIPSAVISGTPQSSVLTSDGLSHPSVDTGAEGRADSYEKVDEQILRLAVPRGTDLASYRWLQLRSRSSLGNSMNVLTNDLSAGPDQEVAFSSLPRAGSQLSVQVGSCLQWHGYRAGTGLYLVRSGPAAARPVSVELRR